VGHVARFYEAQGVPTVIVAVEAFRDTLEGMHVPRALLTPFPMGRPFGAPGDSAQQSDVLKMALNLIEEATTSKTIVHYSRS
jgi:hypothetical protein